MNRPMTVLVLLALLASTACFSLPSSEEAGISYAITPIDWPENAPCLNEETPALAKEIVIGSTSTVVISGGDNEISDEAWEHYWPSFGNQKNSNRNLEFERRAFGVLHRARATAKGTSARLLSRPMATPGSSWRRLCLPTASPLRPAVSRSASGLVNSRSS